MAIADRHSHTNTTAVLLPELVLLGVGSPFVMEFEETCLRLGTEIAAYIKNTDDPAFASDAHKIVDMGDLTPALTSKPVAFPLVTPVHRQRVFKLALSASFTSFPSLVDPTSILAASTQLGKGVFINAGCTIGSACDVGDFVLINRSVSLGHHVTLSKFASVGPGVVVAGRVKIGRGAFIGAGAIIAPDIIIGANAVVAVGTVVRHDVADNTLVAGNPAKVVKPDIPGYNKSGVSDE
jgi:sugar O-acyltransferase (sialic acid O-acetyltransferase NeuD family)